jgi:hypothetical protein
MIATLCLLASLAQGTIPAEYEHKGAKIEYSVPTDWVKLEMYPGAPPSYAPPIYKNSVVPTGPDGYLNIHRDPDSTERQRVRDLWGARDFQIYLVREVRLIPRDSRTECDVEWELNVGTNAQFQMVKERYTGKTPRYWWRGAKQITVNKERYVIVVWRELDTALTAREAEASPVLKQYYEIVNGFQAKK